MDKIYSKILGELVYDKEMDWFEGEVTWSGTSINLYVGGDSETELNRNISIAEDIVKNQQKWNDTVRKYAAKQLTELANDWADDEEPEEPHEITEQEFAERIDLCGIDIQGDGNYTFWFNDDDMFWGHSVTVYGDMENGCTDAAIEG